MGNAPPVVIDPQPIAELGGQDREDEHDKRDPRRGQLPARGARVQLAECFSMEKPQDRKMAERQSDRDQREIAVKQIDDIDPEGSADALEPGGQRELDAEHRDRGKAHPHRQIPPETPTRRHRADDQDYERRKD
jgi:hypothetical protein